MDDTEVEKTETNPNTKGKRSRYRGYCFTINNPKNYEIDVLKNWDAKKAPVCVYRIVGLEIAPSTGTAHLQGYIYFKNAIGLTTLKKIIPRAHIEVAKGTALENKAYCSKDGNVLVEFGEPPQQGKRQDLILIKDEILKGKKVDDICIEEPNLFHQYGRTLNKIEDLALRKKFRKEMTKGIWYFGATGVGKSHRAFEGFDPSTHYCLSLNDKGWWEGYIQQDTVIINDFRGELPYNFLLQLVDKWPISVPRRNREPMPFTSNTVVVTSSLPPNKVYNRRMNEDNIAQLLRRFKVVEIKDGTEVVWGNTVPPDHEEKEENTSWHQSVLNII